MLLCGEKALINAKDELHSSETVNSGLLNSFGSLCVTARKKKTANKISIGGNSFWKDSKIIYNSFT